MHHAEQVAQRLGARARGGEQPQVKQDQIWAGLRALRQKLNQGIGLTCRGYFWNAVEDQAERGLDFGVRVSNQDLHVYSIRRWPAPEIWRLAYSPL